jgi:syntaxin 5
MNKTQFYNPYLQADQANLLESGHASHIPQEQQLLLAPPDATMQYYASREQAVNEVEKTINELGQIFHRLASMISEQGALVDRVDEDVENAVSNTERARELLMKTYESVSSNRALYTKVFAIFAIFIVFFILFML